MEDQGTRAAPESQTTTGRNRPELASLTEMIRIMIEDRERRERVITEERGRRKREIAEERDHYERERERGEGTETLLVAPRGERTPHYGDAQTDETVAADVCPAVGC